MAPYKRNYTITKENFTSNIEATSIRQFVHNRYDRTPLFPPMQSKEAPIPVMSSYNPHAAQHNDHSQMCHSWNIIESHEQQQQTHTRQ